MPADNAQRGDADDIARPPPAFNPAAPAPGEEEEEERSRYTSLKDCTLLRSAPEEGGFYEHACPGVGGYRLRLVEADARHNLFVTGPDGRTHNLGLPALANGAFSSLRGRAEWRGRESGGTFRPDALILRYEIVEDPARPDRTSYLLPVSLGGKGPCVAAKVPPGEAQNERARAVADGPMRCLTPSRPE